MLRTDDILQELTLEDLQCHHREIAEVIGLDGLVALVRRFGGGSIYLPQARELAREKIYRNIYKEYDGCNIRALVAKYGVSERTVYNLVKDKICKGGDNLPGQMTIADLFQEGRNN